MMLVVEILAVWTSAVLVIGPILTMFGTRARRAEKQRLVS